MFLCGNREGLSASPVVSIFLWILKHSEKPGSQAPCLTTNVWSTGLLGSPARDATAIVTLLCITHLIALRNMFCLAVRQISRYRKKLHIALLHSVSTQTNELLARSTLPAPPLTLPWRYKVFLMLLRCDLNIFIQAKWKFCSWQIHMLHWGEKKKKRLFKFSIGREGGSGGLESQELHLIWRTSYRFWYLVVIGEIALTIHFSWCCDEVEINY